MDIDIEKALRSFEEKYNTNKNTGCWIWNACVNPAGYGEFGVPMVDGTYKSMRAHRFSYELLHGSIPKGYVIRHSCENKLCVNPQHLICGTHNQNSHDYKRKTNRVKEQFEEDLIWLMNNTGIVTRTKAYRFALRVLRNTVSTDDIKKYADIGRSF